MIDKHVETLETELEYIEKHRNPCDAKGTSYEEILLDICKEIKALKEKPRLHVYLTDGKYEFNELIYTNEGTEYIGYLTLTEQEE